MSGILLVDKPEGPTSHDMVRLARRLLHTRQVGHTGTLDPMATGLLCLCVDQATRLVPYLTTGEKVYRAVVRLGWSTDTYDRTGRRVGPARPVSVDADRIRVVLDGLSGRRRQVPPAFSAKRIDGVRAHRLARSGSPATPAPVEIEIREFRDLALQGDDVSFEVRCSSGTYVRSLAQELGERLGCGAHLVALRRTHNGEFVLDRAHTVADLERRAAAGILRRSLIPPGELSMGMAAVRAAPASIRLLAHGRALGPADWTGHAPADGACCRILGPDGRLLALAEVRREGPGAIRLHPRRVLVGPSEVEAGPGPGAGSREETA